MKHRFHYTKAAHLKNICTDRFIKPATEFVQKAKPAVWCSTRQDFEPTAAVGEKVNGNYQPMSREQMAEIPLFNPVRIEVTPTSCPYDWRAYVKLSGITTRIAKALEKVARAQGSRHEDWYVSFEAIQSEQWINIAYYLDSEWKVLPMTDSIVQHLSTIPVDNLRETVISLCET